MADTQWLRPHPRFEIGNWREARLDTFDRYHHARAAELEERVMYQRLVADIRLPQHEVDAIIREHGGLWVYLAYKGPGYIHVLVPPWERTELMCALEERRPLGLSIEYGEL